MSMPIPDFMTTKEWGLFEDKEWEGDGWRLKSGAPEWLVKEFEEWMQEYEKIEGK